MSFREITGNVRQISFANSYALNGLNRHNIFGILISVSRGVIFVCKTNQISWNFTGYFAEKREAITQTFKCIPVWTHWTEIPYFKKKFIKLAIAPHSIARKIITFNEFTSCWKRYNLDASVHKFLHVSCKPKSEKHRCILFLQGLWREIEKFRRAENIWREGNLKPMFLKVKIVVLIWRRNWWLRSPENTCWVLC